MGQKQILWGTAVFFLLILAVAACTAPAAEEASSTESDDVGVVVGSSDSPAEEVSNGGSEEVESAASNSEAPPTEGEIVVDLPDMGEAPEFLNEVWLNSDGPVTLASQQGKVVLLEFWTFG